MTLTLRSHERETLTLYFNETCQLLYNPYDLHGERMNEGWGCGFFPTTLTIPPGETIRRQFHFQAVRFDYDVGANVPLPAGLYRFEAFLVRHGYSDPSLERCPDWAGDCFTSPPFAVRILEPESGTQP